MKPVPVTVLTGANEAFLAAAAPALARAAVVLHDAAAGGDAGQIAVGCVCCSVRGGLTVTLLDLLRRAAHGEAPEFERVLVVAAADDAVPVLQEFAASPALAIAFRLDALVAVVGDAAAARTRGDARIADRVLVTGRDAPVPESWLAPAPRAGVRVAPAAIRAKGDDVLEDFTLVWDGAPPLAQLGDWLHTLAAMHGTRILRARGVAAVEGEARSVALHVLGHVVASPVFLEAGVTESRLAFTVRGLEPGDMLPAWPVAALAA